MDSTTSIGVVHKFSAEGFEIIAKTKDSYRDMSDAADTFVKKSAAFAIAGGTIAASGYAMLEPLNQLKDALVNVALFYEPLAVQIRGLMGNNKEMSDQFFNFVNRASVDIPQSVREITSGMKEFVFMGINIGKTYGSVTAEVGGAMQKLSLTSVSAMGGLAAASGASFGQIAHDLSLAIRSGNASYLEHWIGPMNTQLLQVSGAFIGTYQQQADKVFKILGEKYAAMGKQLTQTLQGVIQNTKDLTDTVYMQIFGIVKSGSEYKKIIDIMGNSLSRLTDMFLTASGEPTKLTKDLAKTFNEFLAPAVKMFNGIMVTAVTLIGKFAVWAGDETHRKLIQTFGYGLGLAGLFLTATGIFLGFFGIVTAFFSFLGAVWPVMLGFFLFLVPLAVGLGLFFSTHKNGWTDLKSTVGATIDFIEKRIQNLINFLTVFWQIFATEKGGLGHGTAIVDKAAYESLTHGEQVAANYALIFSNAMNNKGGNPWAALTSALSDHNMWHEVGHDIARGIKDFASDLAVSSSASADVTNRWATLMQGVPEYNGPADFVTRRPQPLAPVSDLPFGAGQGIGYGAPAGVHIDKMDITFSGATTFKEFIDRVVATVKEKYRDELRMGPLP